MRSRVYTAHARPGAETAAVLVEDGFCWPAALAFPLWALWRRMWLAATFFAIVAIGLGAALDALGPHPAVEAALAVAAAIFLGFEGNEWRRRKLARLGYVERGVVVAPDEAEAERRFFARGDDLPTRWSAS